MTNPFNRIMRRIIRIALAIIVLSTQASEADF
jgi:hypothetical protein